MLRFCQRLSSRHATIHDLTPLQQLHRFGLKSRAMRIGGENVKGYTLADLTQAISIWLQS